MAVYGTGLVRCPTSTSCSRTSARRSAPWTYLLVGVLCFLESGAFVGLLVPGETAIVVGGFVAGAGRDRHRRADRDRVDDRGRRRPRQLHARPAPRARVPRQARPARPDHRGAARAGRALLRPSRRQGRLPRPLGRARARRLAVRRRLLGHAAAALPALRHPRRGRDGDRLLPARLRLLALARPGARDRQTRACSRSGRRSWSSSRSSSPSRWLRVEENRRQLDAWLDEQERTPVLGPPIRLAARLGRRLARPARFVWDRLTPGQLGLELTTLLAVAAVGSFVFFGYIIALDPITEQTAGDLRAARWSADAADGLADRPREGAHAPRRAAGGGRRAAGHGDRAVVETPAAGGPRAARRARAHLRRRPPHEGGARPPAPARPARRRGRLGLPVGHAAYAVCWVAIAVALRHAFPGVRARAGVLASGIAIAVAVGLTRIYLRVHWFSDVAGGWGLARDVLRARRDGRAGRRLPARGGRRTLPATAAPARPTRGGVSAR